MEHSRLAAAGLAALAQHRANCLNECLCRLRAPDNDNRPGEVMDHVSESTTGMDLDYHQFGRDRFCRVRDNSCLLPPGSCLSRKMAVFMPSRPQASATQ